MDSKFFDIPFRIKTADSDFSCKDGEIFLLTGAVLKSQGDTIDLYSFLGSGYEAPPPPDIDFAIVRDTLRGWHPYPDVFPMKTLVASQPSMEYWTPLAAELLQRFVSDAARQSLFVAPFLAMAAWKRGDGSLVSPSKPFLLIPNSEAPVVATDKDILSSELEFKIAGAVCSLFFRLRAPEILRERVGEIEELVMLVSQPLVTYASAYSFLPSTRVSTLSFCRSLDIAAGQIADRRICTETLPIGWLADMRGKNYDDSRDFSSGFSSGRFRPFFSIPFSKIVYADGWSPALASNSLGKMIYSDKKDEISFEDLNQENVSVKSREALVEGIGKEIRLQTRPLKLSGAGALKTGGRLYLRGDYDPSQMAITVYGSRDMLCWWKISQRKGGTVVALPRSPFRFFRLEISGFLSAGSNLQGFSMNIC